MAEITIVDKLNLIGSVLDPNPGFLTAVVPFSLGSYRKDAQFALADGAVADKLWRDVSPPPIFAVGRDHTAPYANFGRIEIAYKSLLLTATIPGAVFAIVTNKTRRPRPTSRPAQIGVAQLEFAVKRNLAQMSRLFDYPRYLNKFEQLRDDAIAAVASLEAIP